MHVNVCFWTKTYTTAQRAFFSILCTMEETLRLDYGLLLTCAGVVPEKLFKNKI